MKVLILTDIRKRELREDETDTLHEVKAVKRALRLLGHSVDVGEFSMNLPVTAGRIERSKCDIVFNLVENLSSSRLLHLVPLVCGMLSVPCSGGNTFTLSVTGDKVETKKMLRLACVPTPDWTAGGSTTDCDGADTSDNIENRGKYEAFLNVPVILKPIAQEASVGITDASVRTFSHTEDIERTLSEHPQLFVERYIDGREFNLSILPGGKILPVCEMQFIDYPHHKVKIVGYEAKWEEDSFAYRHTRRNYIFSEQDEALTKELERLAATTYRIFGSSGYARVDFRVDAENRPYILELNSNPCITPDSGFIAAAEQAGLSYPEVIELLLAR